MHEINNIVIVLIPEKQECLTTSYFRLISLCNSSCKIISKAMVNRLKSKVDGYILPKQHGFIPRHEIANNMLLAREAIHSMKLSKRLGMNIKLDVTKAYDKVKWSFLYKVLSRSIFCQEWINCIIHCLSFVHFSVLVNGSLCGFFQATNGLR